MSRAEYVSPEGLRADGRRPGEVRRICCAFGEQARADGSASFAQGNTRVLAAVYGPQQAESRGDAMHDRCALRFRFSSASFSAGERRERAKAHDRRAAEMELLLRQTFEPNVLLELFPQSQITVVVQLVQSDGGERSACINAAALALIDAGVPMRDVLCSCTAGYVDETPIADLTYAEECSGTPGLSLTMLSSSGTVSALQMERRVPLGVFDSVLELAETAAATIGQLMRTQLEMRES